MLDYSEIRERKYIVYEGEPWEVLDSRVFRMQQRKPVNQTRLRNILKQCLETRFNKRAHFKIEDHDRNINHTLHKPCVKFAPRHA